MSAQSGRLQHALKHLQRAVGHRPGHLGRPRLARFREESPHPARTTDQERDHRHGKALGGAGKDPGSVQGRLTDRARSRHATVAPSSTIVSRAWRATVLTTRIMESCLSRHSFKKKTVALSDLEALIADRAKGESETELGFRKRIEREETEYQGRGATSSPTSTRSTASHGGRVSHGLATRSCQTFQRDTQATKTEYAQTKKQIDEQFKKDQRRAKKTKEETGWQALAIFEGSRDEGIKWRRGTDANWHDELDDLHHEAGRRRNTFSSAAAGCAKPPRSRRGHRAEAPAAAGRRRRVPPRSSRRPRPRTPAEPAEAAGGHDSARHAAQDLLRESTKNLLALEALKLPKFLQDRHLHLAVAASGGAA